MSAVLVEIFERGDDRQTADEFGDEAELQQVLGLHLAEDVAGAAFVRRLNRRAEADRGRAAATRDDLLEAGKRTAADEEDVRRVDLQNSCCGCLRPPCGGTEATVPSMILSSACWTPSPDTSRVIEGLSDLRADLVDFVDIDDAALGALDIVVGGLQQLQDDVLDVLADIARLGERRRVGHREGHVEDARERLRQHRLADAGRADQQDVGLRELDVAMFGGVVEALVMVVHRDRERTRLACAWPMT